MQKWISIFIVTIFALIGLLSLNEYLLIRAKHIKTIVSDADLWSIEREKVSSLNANDIILLGASRMQVDVDLNAFKEKLPGRKILQLALSGRGTSFPVFDDLVKSTSFNGIILIDESQVTLTNRESSQRSVVNHFHNDFSLNKKINKWISMWCQERFLFVNPNSNSERLWGNLVAKHSLPSPMFTKTYSSREQTSFFDLTEVSSIYKLRMKGVDSTVAKAPITGNEWLQQIQHWTPLLEEFKSRGGRVVFIGMPLSGIRWKKENMWMPKQEYWDKAMHIWQVNSIHFADYETLQGFRVPDTSHLEANQKINFTEQFAKILLQII